MNVLTAAMTLQHSVVNNKIKKIFKKVQNGQMSIAKRSKERNSIVKKTVRVGRLGATSRC